MPLILELVFLHLLTSKSLSVSLLTITIAEAKNIFVAGKRWITLILPSSNDNILCANRF